MLSSNQHKLLVNVRKSLGQVISSATLLLVERWCEDLSDDEKARAEIVP
jgi:hypothetical protein